MRVSTLPEDDDDISASPLQTIKKDIVGSTFLIDYIDAKSNLSSRQITIYSIGFIGAKFAISAYCHARTAKRTFLIERIQQMADFQTGEIIDSPLEWFTEISSENPTAETLERSAAGLKILSCLAWCDGHLHDKEHQAMMNYVDANALSLDLRWDVIGQFVRSIVPFSEMFENEVSKLKFQGKEEIARIVSAAKNLVLADRIITPEEGELIEYLLERTSTENV